MNKSAVLEPTVAHPQNAALDSWWEKSVKPSAQQKILQTINFNVTKFDDKARTFRAIASTACIDRQGDIIVQAGWELENFKNNPVIPWAHDYYTPPVGRAIEVGVVDGVLQFTYQAPPAGMYDLADTVWNLFRNGFLFSFSVGFIPKDTEGEPSWEGNTYTVCELLEISAVVVPANPQALALAAKMGVINTAQAKQLVTKLHEAAKGLEDVISVDTKVEEPTATEEIKVVEPDEDNTEKVEVHVDPVELKDLAAVKSFNDRLDSMAKIMERVMEKLEGTETVEKGALSASLPVNDDKDTKWDSGEAVAAIKKWSSDDKGDIDFKKYSKAFLWCDPDNKDKQGGYKLPVADVFGSDLKVVWNAVKAVMAVLNGGRGGVDIPDTDREAVYAQVKKYYKKFDEQVPPLKSLTDFETKSHNEDSMGEITMSKDMGEGSGGGSALTPTQMTHVKEAHDYLLNMVDTLSTHADALDGHVKTLAAHAALIHKKTDMLVPHIKTLSDLLDHSPDETSLDDKKPGAKEDSVSDDGISGNSHMGDDSGEQATKPKALEATDSKSLPTDAKTKTEDASGEVKSTEESGDGADHEATEEAPKEEVVETPAEDAGADDLTPEEVDPEALTDEQVEEIAKAVNDALAVSK